MVEELCSLLSVAVMMVVGWRWYRSRWAGFT
jgi:hypothetical protein